MRCINLAEFLHAPHSITKADIELLIIFQSRLKCTYKLGPTKKSKQTLCEIAKIKPSRTVKGSSGDSRKKAVTWCVLRNARSTGKLFLPIRHLPVTWESY